MSQVTANLVMLRHACLNLLRGMAGLPPAYVGLLALVACAALFRENMLSPLLLLLMLRQATPLGLVTLGQSLVVRCRSVDLSSGGIMAGVSYIVTSDILGWSVYPTLAAALAFGMLIGAINGLLITRMRASAVIVTLAMAIVLTGTVVALSQYKPQVDAPELLKQFGAARMGGVPLAPIVWFAVLVPTGLFLRHSVFGRVMDAGGSNPVAAELSGLPYLRTIFIAHVACGLMTVIATLMLLSAVGVGSIFIGEHIAINALAATILGGVNFGSGRGGVWGPAVAAFMLMFLFNLLTSFGVTEAGHLMLQGAIVGGAAVVFSIRSAQTVHT